MPKKPDRGDTSQPKPKKSMFDAILNPDDPESQVTPPEEKWQDPGEVAASIISQSETAREWRLATKAKPRRITSDTVDVLTRLDAAIAAATKHLKKMPGAKHRDVFASVDTVLWHPDRNHQSERFFLQFHDGEIQVCYGSMDYASDEVEETFTSLDKFDANTRIKLCKHIPDLIAAAKAAEEKVREEAEDAIASIEQAIAMSLEVGDE